MDMSMDRNSIRLALKSNFDQLYFCITIQKMQIRIHESFIVYALSILKTYWQQLFKKQFLQGFAFFIETGQGLFPVFILSPGGHHTECHR